MSASREVIRIGGASGFWETAGSAPCSSYSRAPIDYLVFDYLAETTMAILAAARARNPRLGYATDFVEIAMRYVLREIAATTSRSSATPAGSIREDAWRRCRR